MILHDVLKSLVATSKGRIKIYNKETIYLSTVLYHCIVRQSAAIHINIVIKSFYYQLCIRAK